MLRQVAMDTWSTPGMVAGFVQSAANSALTRFADLEHSRGAGPCMLDIGCGAARNALPLARAGWEVFGIDRSWPMLEAAARRARGEDLAGRLRVAQASMDRLPVRDRSMDFIVAHGIWNLARSSDEFRRSVRDAARAAKPGAALFVFTFSRNTLPATAAPVQGEAFVFTQFSGEPQCFLTRGQLVEELAAAGFAQDPAIPLRELNRPAGRLQVPSGPVIFEGTFRFAPVRPF